MLADARSAGRFAEDTAGLCTRNTLQVIEQADCDAVCELTPLHIEDGQPAIDHIRRAFQCGKHVVSANKGPIAWAYDELKLRRGLQNSKVLSSDVSAAYDPNYPAVMEKKNSAYFGKGLVFNKYTGSRGKSGSNDASAEYMAEIRRIMDDNRVSFQTAELGKVDAGGGGTIAYILGNYNMQVIDSGVAVLNMHAPWEIISKADLYEAKRGYVAFLKDA